jgi:hypothetical protein
LKRRDILGVYQLESSSLDSKSTSSTSYFFPIDPNLALISELQPIPKTLLEQSFYIPNCENQFMASQVQSYLGLTRCPTVTYLACGELDYFAGRGRYVHVDGRDRFRSFGVYWLQSGSGQQGIEAGD